jgi:hypothetical protein
MPPSPRDPGLSVYIEPPRTWWMRRLPIVLPLLAWVVVAVGTLLGFRDGAPPLLGLMGLICVGLALVMMALPLVLRSLREVRGTLAVRRVSNEAGEHLLAGDAAAAEARWRSVLHAPMSPSARTVVVHNLGLSVMSGGDAPRGAALMAHARAGGWIRAFVLRRQAGVFTQGAALGHVAVGDLTAAREALAAIARPSPAVQPYAAITRTLLALRAGDGPAALAASEAIDLPGLPANARPLAALARAWSMELGGADADALATAVATGPPLPTGQPAWAAAHWPELRDAAERLGLAASPDPTGDPVTPPSRRGVSDPDSAALTPPSRRGVSDPDSAALTPPSGRGVSDPDSAALTPPSRRGVSDPDSAALTPPNRRGVSDPDSAALTPPSGRGVSDPDSAALTPPSRRTP